MKRSTRVTILGGGVAGLAAGHFARRAGFEVTVYEADEVAGGNCRTVERSGFRFDTGAHRFHGRDPEATGELAGLLGGRLREVLAPSQIYSRGRFINFPLTPLNLALGLGPAATARAGLEVLGAALRKENGPADSLREFAVSRYGPTVAGRFLLNYSEKLWGLPAEALLPEVAGERMKGLTLGSFFRESLLGSRGLTRHLEGLFYYPTGGIEAIPRRLAESCGTENLRPGAKITRVFHARGRIEAVEINQGETAGAELVVSSLPLGSLIQVLEPAPPREVSEAARALKYRGLVLAAVMLDRPRVTPNASVYFPEPEFRFTRVTEPRNRCPSMAPEGKTSLVAEIPADPGSVSWDAPDGELIEGVIADLGGLGWLKKSQVLDACVVRLPCAYPVLSRGTGVMVEKITAWLAGLDNLFLTGRAGLHRYTHIHDLLGFGRRIAAGLAARSPRPAGALFAA
ncbi:MAG: FAD-dependent oxidoreductase [Thermodesulfobacteriota bacterium]